MCEGGRSRLAISAPVLPSIDNTIAGSGLADEYVGRERVRPAKLEARHSEGSCFCGEKFAAAYDALSLVWPLPVIPSLPSGKRSKIRWHGRGGETIGQC